jgi:hypothetical protein
MSQQLVTLLTKPDALRLVARGQRALKKGHAAWKTTRKHLAEYRHVLRALQAGAGWLPLGYRNLEECVREVFGKGRSQAYRDIGAAEIEQQVVAIGDSSPIPEARLRPLAALPSPAARLHVWQEASADGDPTAAAVQAAVDRFRANGTSPEERRALVEAAAARQEAEAALVDRAAEDVHGTKGEEQFLRVRSMAQRMEVAAKRGRRHLVKFARLGRRAYSLADKLLAEIGLVLRADERREAA